MKNKTLLTLALGLAGVTSVMATTVDVYLTGSTAFRANVYTACTKLYSGGPSAIYFGDSNHGGAASGFSSSTAAWVMTGTPITQLTNLAGVTLNIHGLFTGSIQGIQTTIQNTKLTFPNVGGVNTNNGLCGAYVNNTPTIGFSDSASAACPYQVGSGYAEEEVAVIPFVMVKAVGSGFAANVLTNISNVTWEQMEYGIPNGYLPLSAWTYKNSDTNTFIYLLQRTLDSGTRRCETAGMYYQYGDPCGTYIYDTTANNFFYPTQSVLTASASGLAPNGVVGSAGLGNANLNWGYGYVGGGQIASALNSTGSSNTSISFLSMSDAKSVFPSTQTNWWNVVSFNGMWPTTAGAGIHGLNLASANPTNDFSPITSGYYPLWGKEVCAFPLNPKGTIADQNISQAQMGTGSKAGTFMGVFNAQTSVQTNLPAPLAGSIENEIELSKTSLATAIRLSEMKVGRDSVGAVIYPK